ncbi:NADPH-dependent FMN reductase [Lentzea sp. DG1S-22]|uniref:NADPH-dependent FMN reductase n=1 Tax=Lentzea sp. DG1S-22 TaxID=3108822 RepID=UPI002E7768A6|nr:NADPH-dependent FMN reductase [Lentzea sp. DG1S-22]WVH82090.1 NADPH-dependent FMN reductase [Lentzea sp. DG1S-22]
MSTAPEPGTVLVLSASPRAGSRPDWLGDHVTRLLTEAGCRARHLKVRDLPSEALVHAEAGDPELARACAAVDSAEGLVLITPIYRAAYSGLLKLFLDALPRHALAGKTVMPLATGGSAAHVLALDYTLRPVAQTMGARHVVRGHFVHDEELPRLQGRIEPVARTEAAVGAAVSVFHRALLQGAQPTPTVQPWNVGA